MIHSTKLAHTAFLSEFWQRKTFRSSLASSCGWYRVNWISRSIPFQSDTTKRCSFLLAVRVLGHIFVHCSENRDEKKKKNGTINFSYHKKIFCHLTFFFIFPLPISLSRCCFCCCWTKCFDASTVSNWIFARQESTAKEILWVVYAVRLWVDVCVWQCMLKLQKYSSIMAKIFPIETKKKKKRGK